MFRRLLTRISSFSVTRKLVLIYLLDLLVTASVVVSYVGDKSTQIDFSTRELDGTAIIVPLQDLYRGLIDESIGAKTANGANVEHGLAATDAARAGHGAQMDLDADWRSLTGAAGAYEHAGADTRAARLVDYQDRLDSFEARVGDHSNLILDPDLDSFYAMEIVVVHMPAILRNIVDLSDAARRVSAGNATQRGRLFYLDGSLRHVQADIRQSLDAGAGGNADGSFEKNLGEAGASFSRLLDNLSATANRGGDVMPLRDDALRAGFAFWRATTDELNRLLDRRVQTLYHQMFLKLGITFGLALGVLMAVIFIGRQIVRPVKELAAVAKTVGGRDPRRALWQSNDEFGALVDAFNAMLIASPSRADSAKRLSRRHRPPRPKATSWKPSRCPCWSPAWTAPSP